MQVRRIDETLEPGQSEFGELHETPGPHDSTWYRIRRSLNAPVNGRTPHIACASHLSTRYCELSGARAVSCRGGTAFSRSSQQAARCGIDAAAGRFDVANHLDGRGVRRHTRGARFPVMVQSASGMKWE